MQVIYAFENKLHLNKEKKRYSQQSLKSNLVKV